MFAQVQTSVEIISPVPENGKCGEKEYERIFIREPEVKAREGKMVYVRPEYHDRIMRITRVIGHGRLSLSADFTENVVSEFLRTHRDELNRMLKAAPTVEL